jgi:type III secretory pathway component EscS
MSSTAESRNLSDLLGDLLTHAARLLRQEITLARAEMFESLAALNRQLMLIALACALGLLGLACVVGLLVMTLAFALERVMSPQLAVMVSLLVVGALLLVIAYAVIRQSLQRIKNQSVLPRVMQSATQGAEPRTRTQSPEENTTWQPMPQPQTHR